MGFAWSVPVASKENNRAKTNGGGKRIIGGGGPKTVFGEGFYGMFSPPLSFPPPLFFSENRLVRKSAVFCENLRLRNAVLSAPK